MRTAEKEDGLVNGRRRVVEPSGNANDIIGEISEFADEVARCFGVLDVTDSRPFDREDMARLGTPARLTMLSHRLRALYTPCKARVYLDQPITLQRALTILKHVLRSSGRTLMSRERNVRGKKTTYYQIIGQDDVEKLRHMTKKSEADAGYVAFG